MFKIFQHTMSKRLVAAYVGVLIFASIGLLTSFVLSVEAVTLAANPSAELSCSLNAVVNCAAVGSDPSASVFGFPNAFVGMMAFPVLIALAVAALMGAKLPKPFVFGGFLGACVGILFAGWMLYMSFFVIQILCPWCLTLDAAMIGLFIAMLRVAINENVLPVSKKFQKNLEHFSSKGYDILVGVLIIVAIIAAIILKYGSSF